METNLKTSLQEAVKEAMRAQDKPRLNTLRLVQAALKQWEVDKRSELNNEQILSILDKMVSQRRESIKLFEQGGRQDLITKEQAEIAIIQEFLPAPLTEVEVLQLVKQAIEQVGAQSMQDMSKVMALLKPNLQGRADMGVVGGLIKNLLSQ